ncbi:hypothetical protein [Roseivirga thermotolerans]|nr:hypothetical protein [Roseivirga thermotolerans]
MLSEAETSISLFEHGKLNETDRSFDKLRMEKGHQTLFYVERSRNIYITF